MKKMTIDFNLPVSILREDKAYVAYTPALDLSTSAKSFKAVQQNFAEAVTLFFEELQEAGTTDEVLTELGWHKQGKQLIPPVVVAHQTEDFSIPITS